MVAEGDPTISKQRQNLLQSLIFLDLTEEAIALAQEFLQQGNLPPKPLMMPYTWH